MRVRMYVSIREWECVVGQGDNDLALAFSV